MNPSIESLFNHFQKESNTQTRNENLNIHVDIELNLEDENNTLNKKITADEIMKCIKNLKNNKSPVTDQVINEYIKNSRIKMVPLYTNLFNLIIDIGYIPKTWGDGMIIPIYKGKGDPSSQLIIDQSHSYPV